VRNLGPLIGVVIVAAATTAAAQPAADANRREAGDHARKGVALYKLGRYLEAIDEFEQAYVLYPSDALLYNLGQSHRQLDHCREALDYYKRFLDGSPDSPLAPKVRDLLPPLERACAVKYERPVDVAGANAPATSVPEPSPDARPADPLPDRSPPAITVAAPPPAPEDWHVHGGLGAGVLSSGGVTAAPVGPVVMVTHAIAGDYALGARLGAGLFASDFSATASAVEVLAIGGRSIVRDDLTFAAYGGVGVLAVSQLPRSLSADGLTARDTIAMPELAALATIDRDLGGAWSLGAGAEVATGPSSAFRGGAAIAASLVIGVGYRR
jgi:tetratricopeptide (TPR) repeat protein